jgi:hypothetical protein
VSKLKCLLTLLFFTLLFFAQQKDSHAKQDHGIILEQSIFLAEKKKLWEERYWQLLLHFDPQKSDWISEADSRNFFLAPDGKSNPRSELFATLEMMFTTEPVARTQEPTLCAFPERTRWLRGQLNIPEEVLPSVRCDRFINGLGTLRPKSITLVFSSYYLSNPSSMFGHTLLRIDQETTTEGNELLEYAINYAADVEDILGLEYVVRGAFGYLNGYFSLMPYYLMVRDYNDWENRDLFEYKLNLTPEQIQRLIRHLWELGQTSFDYYFFDENCSYHLLSLLEIANPQLQLRQEFWLWATPVETLRLVQEQPGLVEEVYFRPSRQTKVLYQFEQFSETERAHILSLLEIASLEEVETVLSSMSVARKSQLMEVASEILQYRSVDDIENRAFWLEKQHVILRARSRIHQPSTLMKVPDPIFTPEVGHRTSRIGVGIGQRENHFFNSINLRPSYHDLLDPLPGYQEQAQISVFDTHFRHYPENGLWQLEELKILEIYSLALSDDLFSQLAWKAKLASQLNDQCFHCRDFLVNSGIGFSRAINWKEKAIWYVLGEVEVRHRDSSQSNYFDIAPGMSVGGLISWDLNWRSQLQYRTLHWGIDGNETLWSFGQSVAVDTNQSFRFTWKENELHHSEFVVQGFYFF